MSSAPDPHPRDRRNTSAITPATANTWLTQNMNDHFSNSIGPRRRRAEAGDVEAHLGEFVARLTAQRAHLVAQLGAELAYLGAQLVAQRGHLVTKPTLKALGRGCCHFRYPFLACGVEELE